MTTKIQKSYLMWVGAEHYPTIEDYVKECVEMGVSKRLPNATVAEALMAPGTVVFVAHDEGVYHECPECVGEMECPGCRLLTQATIRVETEREDLEAELEELETERIALAAELLTSGPDQEEYLVEKEMELKTLVTKMRRTDTKIRKRTEKVIALRTEGNSCEECEGTGTLQGGTGGTVGFNDGDVWDYVRYNYWLHQPQSWTPNAKDGITEITQCECCGGTGRLPDGVVFGCFVPRHAEYVLKAEDTATVIREMEARKFKVVSEMALALEVKRGCGLRVGGGVYVMAAGGAKTESKSAKDTVKELIKSGAIENGTTEITGDFVQFLSPVEIASKRFRGIKSWSLDPVAEDEVEMALDGLED